MEYAADELDMTRWVVVGTAGNARFFGQLESCDEHPDIKECLTAALEHNRSLKLFPVFEFLAPLQQKEDGFMRKPLILPVDFVLHGTPLYVRPVFAYLCRDMHESDKYAYKGFVEQSLELQRQLIEKRDGGMISGGPTH